MLERAFAPVIVNVGPCIVGHFGGGTRKAALLRVENSGAASTAKVCGRSYGSTYINRYLPTLHGLNSHSHSRLPSSIPAVKPHAGLDPMPARFHKLLYLTNKQDSVPDTVAHPRNAGLSGGLPPEKPWSLPGYDYFQRVHE